MLGEDLVHAFAEGLMALAESNDFGVGKAFAPLETIANGGLKVVEVAEVKACGFGSLDGSEDGESVCPPGDVYAGGGEAKGLKLAEGSVERCDDCGFAVVEECVVDEGEAGEGDGWGGGRRREEVGEERGIFEMAEEDAHGVEGLGQVRAAAPVASADGGAISGQAAKGGGDADGAAGVGADGEDGGAFLDAGSSAGG